jgi:hypothetical protein
MVVGLTNSFIDVSNCSDPGGGMFMTRGSELTAEEAAHVENTLARVLQEAADPHPTFSTNEFLRELGWPRRRQPDLRDYLESNAEELCARLAERIGRPLGDKIMVSRASLWFPREPPSLSSTAEKPSILDGTVAFFVRNGHEALPPAWVLEEQGIRSYFENTHGEQWIACATADAFLITGGDIDWETKRLQSPDYPQMLATLPQAHFLLDAPPWAFELDLALAEDERAWLQAVLTAASKRYSRRN